MILLDTSAVYALADADDRRHGEAVRILDDLERAGRSLLLHSYVLVETFALLHARLGLAQALVVESQLRALPFVVVDRALHERATALLRDAPGRRTSLVDAVSFVLMRERGLEAAFAFDADFAVAGLRTLTAPEA